MSLKNEFIKNFTIIFSIHKICTIFVELQAFIFPYMIMHNFLIYFYNVVKMVIIHKKIITFSYRQVA